MQYYYSPPQEEKHEVKWYALNRDNHRIYSDKPIPIFGQLYLSDELKRYLDTTAPNWSYRSEYDQDEGDFWCILKVSSESQAKAFIAKVKDLS